MYKVCIAGAGKIGSLIACMLSQVDAYEIHLVDMQFNNPEVQRLLQAMPHIHTATIDVTDSHAISRYIQQHELQVLISSLPYYANIAVAKLAKQNNLHYFDLTEDTQVTQAIKELSQQADSVFVPQCGVAPGVINIIANSMMQQFERLDSAKLRVGALPQYTHNALHYALTWSTDGLINEYGNSCHAIDAGKPVMMPPLEMLESLQLNGIAYEAFNTSGGLGSLTQLYAGKINTLNYKTVRYPGHCEKMKFLMNELKLNDDRNTLKYILERAIPKTYQDMVLVHVAVNGIKYNEYVEQSYLKIIYPDAIAGIDWSAIQIATASGICTVVDIVLSNISQYHGLVLQEKLSLEAFLHNRFGHYYR